MKKHLTLATALSLFGLLCYTPILQAQVKGVSYTIAPRAAYLFPGDDSGLDRTFALGGDFGFNFGQFVELRATYLRSISSQTDFSDYGLDNFADANIPQRDVTLQRYGGDLRLNLSQGTLLPYLLVGTGIQRLELDGGPTNENIYGNAGLGIVVSAASRYTIFLEGRYTTYNSNALNALLLAEDRSDLGIAPVQSGSGRIGNYSAEAGLAFYLGGRDPQEMSEVDKAYAEKFNNGFKGGALTIEPSLARINFDGALPYRDTWFGGAGLGVNFGSLVGIRGYYMRAMEDGDISLDFDELNIYGGDARFRLNNVATGLAPYLTLGGGYIDANDEYLGVDEADDVRSQGFATGGLGLIFGLSDNIRLRGEVKSLLTSAEEADDISSTD